ncbi:hypothetical protein [Acuticoccus mangrovi]|uniref:Sulfotransferase family protein n=1 Tax=Acuticoccus mangrovi TaxID=2796142 RepID=A0A934INY9_9HYPH|nr:hypothetical protein [Acuticoccus mangrovi]MBJ3776075.1 hypothetical protein [Acuticoccus mangrovi]
MAEPPLPRTPQKRPPPPPAERPLLIYVHIQKTAGTSMREFLNQLLGKKNIFWHGETGSLADLFADGGEAALRRYTLIGGHFSARHPALQALEKPHLFLSMMREPTQQILSHFAYVDSRPENALHSDRDIAATLADPTHPFTEFSKSAQCRMLTGRTKAAPAERVIRRGPYLIGCVERFDDFLNAIDETVRPLGALKPKHLNMQRAETRDKLGTPEVLDLIAPLAAEDAVLHRKVMDDGVIIGDVRHVRRWRQRQERQAHRPAAKTTPPAATQTPAPTTADAAPPPAAAPEGDTPCPSNSAASPSQGFWSSLRSFWRRRPNS